MTDVFSNYHGGDGGGNDEPWQWKPSSGCKGDGGKRGRGASTNTNLYKKWEENKRRPLHVEFEDSIQHGAKKTASWRAVGGEVNLWNTFMGVETRKIPIEYPTWDDVPEHYRLRIWEEIPRYFDMSRYMGGDPRGDLRKTFEAGINHQLKERYRRAKEDFAKWYVKGGPRQPEGMSDRQWEATMAFYRSLEWIKKSETNTANRAKQKIGRHGRKIFGVIRKRQVDEMGHEASPIENWFNDYCVNGQWKSEKHERQYGRMLRMQNENRTLSHHLSDMKILQRALEKRGGWLRGFGASIKKALGGKDKGKAVRTEPSSAEDDDGAGGSGPDDDDSDDGGVGGGGGGVDDCGSTTGFGGNLDFFDGSGGGGGGGVYGGSRQ